MFLLDGQGDADALATGTLTIDGNKTVGVKVALGNGAELLKHGKKLLVNLVH